MFSFPVTVPVRKPDRADCLKVNVAIDEIAVIKALLDNRPQSGVYRPHDLLPLSEIVFVDGRKLPVLEAPADLNKYLDAYRVLENFYTGRAATVEEVEPVRKENVIPLFQGGPCATSEGSTPA